MRSPLTTPGLFGLLAALQAADPAPPVRLDTVGYLPDAPKVATLAGPAREFKVLRVTDGSTAFAGLPAGPRENPDTRESLWVADFTGLQDPGRYRLDAPGLGESAPFEIKADLYPEPFRLVTRAMYLWRCGTAVCTEHHGVAFAHGICHTNDALLDFVGQPGKHRPSTGGWHDAGDYNKYVVNAGITVGCLLRAWEDFGPAIRKVPLGLPEANGELPEFLAEVKWELDWLLTMQADDGRVHHKVSTPDFGPMISPDREKTPRYFAPWSTAATADFVAMMAQASRVFRPFDAAYADRCLAAARRSFAVLEEHSVNVRADLAGFTTGAYQTRDEDDRLWAAAELWESTGDAAALADLEARLRANDTRVDQDFDWGSVANLGCFTYLASHRDGRDADLLEELRGSLLRIADGIVRTRSEHGYGRPLGNRYYWGCNGSVARQSLILHAAFRVSAVKVYRETALDALHHLFGRNPYGRSFVTGLGFRPPMHPHDRESEGDTVEPPWPGYLVGGANPRATDWKDDAADYRTNEIAINWNGALIYALAAFLPGADAGLRDPASPPRRPDIVFVPTPQVVVDRMLEMADLHVDDVLYELGCGDGRIMVTAAKRYGVRAVGFDIDPRRVAEAIENVRTNHLEHLVTVRQADVFTLDLREASVVTLYLLPQLNVRLMPQLAQLKPGSRILSHDFDMRGARPVQVERMEVEDPELAAIGYEVTEHTIYKWIVPWQAEPAIPPP
ncbi:MAG: glycoside hydrolase family 9 protein [Verrucomicrobiales bacterium]|nr:glycoside hydrolase family 9 protein [Verrucomicrobiales bacterium]